MAKGAQQNADHFENGEAIYKKTRNLHFVGKDNKPDIRDEVTPPDDREWELVGQSSAALGTDWVVTFYTWKTTETKE